MKVIFLDIDGVLNVLCQGRDDFGCLFHKHFEDNLRRIIDQTGAKIVISSTWRLDGFDVMIKMWKHRNLAGEVIGITPFVDICKRGEEIQQWLDKVPVENYVIIDDDTDMLADQMNNYVKTSGNDDHPDCVDIGYGLTKKCAKQAIEILNRNNAKE